MEIIVTIICSSAMASVVSGVFGLISAHQKKDSNIEAGIQILLYDRIKYLGTKYIGAGQITFDSYEDLVKMYRVYHDAFNDGFLDDIMYQVKNLPKK